MQKTADKAKFRQLIQMLGANFRADVTTPLLQAYWVGLSDLAIEKVAAAVKRAMRECEFMPPVAKLRELVKRRETKALCPMPASQLGAERARCVASFEGKEGEVRAMIAALPTGCAWRATVERLAPVKP